MEQINSHDHKKGALNALRVVTAMRKVYQPLGFSKGYNFPLFFIFAGAMFAFSLARLSYLNVGGSADSSFAEGSSPGEWYRYHKGHYRIGITIHLATSIPAGLLMVWQFVPIIRYKALLFHRINGYTIIILVFLSNVGALMVARRAFGGSLETQAVVGMLVILTTVAISMAYYNIKRLQIEQHRAWMLRAVFYLGVIITTRLIMAISAVIITRIGNYFQIQTCGQVTFVHESLSEAASLYPECANATADTKIIVNANFGTEPEKIGASLGMSFGMAMWLSLVMHLVGVEIYLALTPREGERLRKISYEKQLEAGYKNPGSAGLTSDRWGDAEKWEAHNCEPVASAAGKD